MKTIINGKKFLVLVFLVFFGFSLLHGQNNRNTPIDVNLIIDGCQALSGVKDEVTSWISRSIIDQMLITGDMVTIWSAGETARVLYSSRITGDSDKEAVRKTLSELPASGNNADFSGALREAASRQQSSRMTYTLLISASPAALSSFLAGPQANLVRFSRVEEFSGWRILIIGLNIDTRVRNAASAYFGS